MVVRPLLAWPEPAGCMRQRSLGQVLSNKTRHFEHRHLGLAHHRLKLDITKDIALVRWVLEVVQLDVIPQQLGDLGSRLGRTVNLSKRVRTDHDTGNDRPELAVR